MIPRWRLSGAALRFVFQPATGIFIGLAGAVTFWLAALLWPTNVAVMLSMLASLALSTGQQRSRLSGLYWVFALLLEYNLLMSLSSAQLPYSLPEHVPLGLILIAGHAASHAMAASVTAAPKHPASIDFIASLMLGLAPAVLLGAPGLIGLVSAIGMRLVLGVWVLSRLDFGTREPLEVTRRVTAICFYLGALATWNYS